MQKPGGRDYSPGYSFQLSVCNILLISNIFLINWDGYKGYAALEKWPKGMKFFQIVSKIHNFY
jgi:hypothetical protein